jgi:NADH-quinone oxidoreductase subunit N
MSYGGLLGQLRIELLTLVAALAVILVDLVQPVAAGRRSSRRWLGWLSAALAVAILVEVSRTWAPAARSATLWRGAFIQDQLALVFKGIFLLGVAVASLGSVDFAVSRFRSVGEYYGLLFFSALGMMLMASAGDLITLYLGLELATISLYVLTSYAKLTPRSAEAGLKYIILGATASAIYLYGASLIYGSVGSTRFAEIARMVLPDPLSSPGLAAGAILVVAAFAFKVAAAPFHMWAPDVYQGAPTPVTGFLSTASKAAGFVALIRLLMGPLHAAWQGWSTAVLVLSAFSMVVGNLVAISQRDIKRMLAYSGIAQAGYALVGVAAASGLGSLAAVFFLFQYLFTNLGAFLVATAVGSQAGDDQITSYHGLSRRNPTLALALLLFLLSLGGIPPLAGFWAKLFLFWAGIRSGLYGIVLLGVLASVLSLYYYLMVARAMYIEPAAGRAAVRVPFPLGLAVAVCAAVVVGLAYPTYVLEWAKDGAVALLAMAR